MVKEFAPISELHQVMTIQSHLVSPETVLAWTSGCVQGEVRNPELIGTAGIFESFTTLSVAENVTFMPAFGAVSNVHGQVYAETIAEAKFAYPDLSFLATNNQPTEIFEESCIFLPWGGVTNYGHFVLDGLAGVEALRYGGHTAPLLAPPLKNWQRELLAMMGETAVELDADIVGIKKAAWSSCMDHFLHAPNKGLSRLRHKLAANLPAQERLKGIYVSRSRNANEKRRMLNEEILEQALLEHGFLIIYPEDFSIFEQAQFFARANIVLSATGAQFANIVFCRSHTKIIELCPVQYTGVWIRNLSYALDLKWCCYYFDALEKTINDYSFEYRIDIDQTISFLNQLENNQY